MVREERLELSHLAAPEPKSGVSTNFTIPASNFNSEYTLIFLSVHFDFYYRQTSTWLSPHSTE